MKATLSNYRQSPRKVRLVADLVKGKSVNKALLILSTTNKRATVQLKKLVLSAVANAKQKGDGDGENLVVKDMRVDEGVTLKRLRPVSRGSAHPIRKRTSRVTLELEKTQGEVQNEVNNVAKK